MDRLIEVIRIIDESLKNFYFKDVTLYGLTSLEKKDGKNIPVSYEGFGENKFTLSDSMGIYHRVVGESNDQDNEDGFGRSPLLTETYSMKMVVHGNQRKINDTNVDINPRIADDLSILFPIRLTKAESLSVDAQSVIILKGVKNFNKEELWAEEFETSFKLKPESLFFSFNYEIQMKFI